MENVFLQITAIICLAAFLAIIFRVLKQPLLLAYILTGFLIGPFGLFKFNESHDMLKVLGEFGIQAYFADPYASWQRGGNENCNLWIRYYFPKGTGFATITDEALKDIENELNNRPRKRLKFITPQEVFSEYLNIA